MWCTQAFIEKKNLLESLFLGNLNEMEATSPPSCDICCYFSMVATRKMPDPEAVCQFISGLLYVQTQFS